MARFVAAQRRRIITHAPRYAWRDGTLEVETAGLLVVIAVCCLLVAGVPAFHSFSSLRIEAIAVLLGLLVLGVEVLASGFRYHISQGVGGLVGRPKVDSTHRIGGLIAAALSVAVIAASAVNWTAGHAREMPVPLGLVGGALGLLGALVGSSRGTKRIIIASAVIAGAGWLVDEALAHVVLDPPTGFVLGLVALSSVPLVSGVLGFHQYRLDVDDRHDDYVRDAAALLGSPKAAQRAIAAESLGRLAGIDVVEPLVSALGDGDEDVRLAAAFALAEMRELVPARLVAHRLDARHFDPAEPVPAEVLEEVTQLAMLEWQDMLAERYRELLTRPDVLRALEAASGAEQPAPLRRTAVRILAETRDPAAVAHLVTLLTADERVVHGSARGALAWTGRVGAEALAPLLHDEREWVRREASAALLGLVRYTKDADDIRVLQLLREGSLPEATMRAGDPSEEWQHVAAVCQEAFCSLAGDHDEIVREAAAIALDILREVRAAAK